MRRLLTKSNESEYNTSMGVVPKSSPTIQCRAPELRLLTMKDVAQRLGISLQRTYEMGRLGLLPIVRLGRQLRVEEGRLTSWIQNGGRGLPGGWKRNSD
jgi:excisionase family DNA binding protein